MQHETGKTPPLIEAARIKKEVIEREIQRPSSVAPTNGVSSSGQPVTKRRKHNTTETASAQDGSLHPLGGFTNELSHSSHIEEATTNGVGSRSTTRTESESENTPVEPNSDPTLTSNRTHINNITVTLMEESTNVSPPVPVQVIKFVDAEEVEGSTKILLDKDSLQKILAKGGDRPAIIISIVGSNQRGKSFFLNFYLKYLNGLAAGQSPETITSNSYSIPEGFPWGVGARTSGIYFWSDPFIVQMPDHRECAVFLMDTEGLVLSTKPEFLWTVGLSTLVSSCLIFNQDLDKTGRISEDYFLALMHFIQTSMKEIPHKLEQILFLLRDCGMDSFGKTELLPFLKEQFKVETPAHDKIISRSLPSSSTNRHTNRLKSALEIIPTAFETISSWRLPFPFTTSSFEPGCCNKAIDNLDPVFVNTVFLALQDILSPRNLKIKKVLNVEIPSNRVHSIFESYVSLFNAANSNAPETKDILATMRSLAIPISIPHLLKTFEEKMNTCLQNSRYGFLRREEFDLHSQKVQNKLREDFKSMFFISDLAENPTLECGMDDMYKKLRKANDKIVARAYTLGFWDHFDSTMEECAKLLEGALEKDTIGPNIFENIQRTCLENFQKRFPPSAQQVALRLSPALTQKINSLYKTLQLARSQSRPETTLVQPLENVRSNTETGATLGGPTNLSVTNSRLEKGKNVPTLGVLATGDSFKSLRIKFGAVYYIDAARDIKIVKIIQKDEGKICSKSLKSIIISAQDTIHCQCKEAILVIPGKIKLCAGEHGILGTTFEASGLKLLGVTDMVTALVLGRFTANAKLVENKILATVVVVDDGENTADIYAGRASESVLDLGREVMTGLKFRTLEEVEDTMDRMTRLMARWLENDRMPILFLVSDVQKPKKAEVVNGSTTADNSDSKTGQKFRELLFSEIAKLQPEAVQIKFSELSLGVAAYGELLRRRRLEIFTLSSNSSGINEILSCQLPRTVDSTGVSAGTST